jgi:hypothetical protein
MRIQGCAGIGRRTLLISATAFVATGISAVLADEGRPVPGVVGGSRVDVTDVTAINDPMTFSDPVVEEVMRPLYNAGAAGQVDAQQACGAFGGASIPAALAMFAALSWASPRRRR